MSDLEYLKYYLNKSLGLDEFLNNFERKQFYNIVTSYVNSPAHHVSSVQILRSYIDELIKVLESFDLSKMDIAAVIVNEPSLIFMDPKHVYYKYLMVGATARLNESMHEERKERIVSKPQDLRTSLLVAYARFRLCLDVGYPEISWSLLLHISEDQFATRFISDGTDTPYKCFTSKEELSNAKLIERYPLDGEDLTYLEGFDANKEIARRYHEKSKNK